MAERARLTPPNRGALWASLALTKTQLAELCRLSVRQVGWWTEQGYLPRSTRDPQRYSGEAVDTALLIKQGQGAGLTLRQAVRQARAYLAAQRAQQPDLHALDAAALAALQADLAQAETALRTVLEVFAPLAPAAPRAQGEP